MQMNRDLPPLSWGWAGAGLAPASSTALGCIPCWASWGTPVGGTGIEATSQMCQGSIPPTLGRGLGAGQPRAPSTWEGSQDPLPTLLRAVLSPFCYARRDGSPTFEGDGDNCPWDGAQPREMPCRVWSQPQPCWLGGDSSSTPRQPQMKSAASAGNLGPAVLEALLLLKGDTSQSLGREE